MAIDHPVTRQECTDLRIACQANQAVLRSLTEEAVLNSTQLCEIKSELMEKHQETLTGMMISRVEKSEKDITDVHRKINMRFNTALIGCIVGLVALLIPFSQLTSRITSNENGLTASALSCVRGDLNISERLKEKIDECRADINRLEERFSQYKRREH